LRLQVRACFYLSVAICDLSCCGERSNGIIIFDIQYHLAFPPIGDNRLVTSHLPGRKTDCTNRFELEIVLQSELLPF
uniref:Secreted protein n=1 Tax=Ascaris lumbricoides TaxID=6252 RepID=A0A0M3INJ1_ASCLU